MKFLIVVFLMSNVSAQMVQSSAYNLMLKGLLSHSVKEISCDSASKLNNVVFLDAREAPEFETSSLPNAIYVGFNNFNGKAVANLPKDTTIIVYCSVGYRSEKITEKLLKLGFTNVKNLYGGIFEWVNQGNAVFKNGIETENIHAYNRIWGIWLNKGNKVYN